MKKIFGLFLVINFSMVLALNSLVNFSANIVANDIFIPVLHYDYDKRKALLGKQLFFDTRISQKHYSCNTCHHLKGEFTGTSPRFRPELNPPTVLNAALNYLFGHEGKVQTLKDQLNFTLKGKDGLESEPRFIIEKVKKNPQYEAEFNKLYNNGVTFENIKDTLSEFLKALITPSKFDLYIAGDQNALSEEQKQGLVIFIKKGCVSCHNGRNLGGNMISKFELYGESVVRKVPSMRNILRTAPYMADGTYFDLKEAIKNLKIINTRIVLTDFTDQEFNLLFKFFEALNGSIPEILNEN